MAPRDWHDEEDRRANKRSLRRAIVAILVIGAIGYLWFAR
jgi:hypothetical protein